VLLAERDEDALLQSVEARLNAPVGWQRCARGGDAFPGRREADFRALSDVEEALTAVEDHTEELSALAFRAGQPGRAAAQRDAVRRAAGHGLRHPHRMHGPRRGDPLPRGRRDGLVRQVEARRWPSSWSRA
jgi:hypothetical protein